MKTLAAVSAVLLTISGLSASEFKIREIRVGANYSPAIDSVKSTWSPNAQSIANKDSFLLGTTHTGELTTENPGWRIHVLESFGKITSRGGVVFGMSLGQSERTTGSSDLRYTPGLFYDETSDTYVAGVFPVYGPMSVTTTSFDLHVAYAIGVGDCIHFELGGFVGGGSAVFEDVMQYHKGDGPDVIQPLESGGSGNYLEQGLELSGVATFSSGIQLGLTATYIHASGSNSLHLEETSADVSFNSHGFGGELFVGYRF